MFKKLMATCVAGIGILIGGQAASADSIEYEGNSIVDYLHIAGEDFSFENRKELAKEAGMGNYVGSASQNLFLLATLRGETPTVKPTAKVVKTEKPDTKKAEGKTVTVEATAYTAYCEGCSGTTYTGINLRANPNQKVIAVDPNVIPLGSKVYVEGYGEAIAGDIGGLIKGHRIDVFIPNKSEAYKWGRKTVKVIIIE